ncbi:MAG: peptidase M14 [Chloroflexi bacterium]|nr:peptidase M14 [Chloroflexota bacterium]
MRYPIDFSEYFLYDALTEHLHGLAAAHAAFASLGSIGKSWRGREVWCLTITNPATGSPDRKPAFYIDAHIHAEEVATSHTALYTAWYLLENYGTDPLVTWLLDNMTFYILPRLNPDGAEISLTTGHHWCGNGRYLPGEEQTAGLCQYDINGDGAIVQMRVEDPAGEWKVSDEDPRLMVLREPGEVGGQYYRMFREGEIRGDWDGVSFEIQKPRDGNMNRNFPAGWYPENRQYGAGEYPLSEPEAMAAARFIMDHTNISGMQCYHTHGGLHLRPSLIAPDSSIPRADLAIYKTIGAMAEATTGYPVISVYEEFTPDPSQARTGSIMQWTYDEMGIITFSTELWNPEIAAGLEHPEKYQVRARSTDDEIRLLKYNDEHLGGKGFIPWAPFDHPQLGRVEIGGWTHMYTFRNPPPASWAATEKARGFLHETIHHNCLFTLKHAACTPLVRIPTLTAESLGADLYKITAVVKNEGFLPTNLTEMAIKQGVARTTTAALHSPEGVELIMGDASQDLGHLAGRDERNATWSPWLRQWTSPQRKAEWLVRAPAGATLTVEAGSPRAGVTTCEVTLT